MFRKMTEEEKGKFKKYLEELAEIGEVDPKGIEIVLDKGAVYQCSKCLSDIKAPFLEGGKEGLPLGNDNYVCVECDEAEVFNEEKSHEKRIENIKKILKKYEVELPEKVIEEIEREL